MKRSKYEQLRNLFPRIVTFAPPARKKHSRWTGEPLATRMSVEGVALDQDVTCVAVNLEVVARAVQHRHRARTEITVPDRVVVDVECVDVADVDMLERDVVCAGQDVPVARARRRIVLETDERQRSGASGWLKLSPRSRPARRTVAPGAGRKTTFAPALSLPLTAVRVCFG